MIHNTVGVQSGHAGRTTRCGSRPASRKPAGRRPLFDPGRRQGVVLAAIGGAGGRPAVFVSPADRQGQRSRRVASSPSASGWRWWTPRTTTRPQWRVRTAESAVRRVRAGAGAVVGLGGAGGRRVPVRLRLRRAREGHRQAAADRGPGAGREGGRLRGVALPHVGGLERTPADAATLADGLATEFSVTRLPSGKGYVLVYTESGLGDRSSAGSPTLRKGRGPTRVLLYRCPEMAQGQGRVHLRGEGPPVGGNGGRTAGELLRQREGVRPPVPRRESLPPEVCAQWN